MFDGGLIEARFRFVGTLQDGAPLNQSETEDQICSKRNGIAVDGQWFEVPALDRLHAGGEEFIGAITCHDFDDVTVGINGCPK